MFCAVSDSSLWEKVNIASFGRHRAIDRSRPPHFENFRGWCSAGLGFCERDDERVGDEGEIDESDRGEMHAFV